MGEEQEKCERNSPADTKVSEGEQQGGFPGAGAEIPLLPMKRVGCPPAAHGGPHQSRYSRYPHWSPCQSRWMCSEGSCSLWRAHKEAGSAVHGGPIPEQSIPGVHLMERTHAGTVFEVLQLVWKTHIGIALQGLYPVAGIPHHSREL